jgi:phosphoglycerate dehydrogenase-like enzyme
VYDPEPPAADHPLFSLPNTICTSHIGSYTEASVVRMQIMACEQVGMALRGERPTTMVNPKAWERRRGANE